MNEWIGMGTVGEHIFEIAQWVILGVAVLLFAPIRHRTRIRGSRLLHSSAQTVWEQFVDLPDFTPERRPDNPLLPPLLAGYRKLSDDPLLHEMTLDLSKGQRTTMTTMRTRTLLFEAPQRTVVTVEDMNGVPYPMGKDARLEVRLDEVPGGVRYTQIHDIDVRSPMHNLATRYSCWTQLNRIARHYNEGKSGETDASWRGILVRLALTLATVASFALAFGWMFGIGLALIFLLHEFGHWGAMRLAGYSKARFTLLPFLGGVATPGGPYRTQWDNAVCVLMGPGLSAVACGPLLAAAWLLDGPAVANHIDLSGAPAPGVGHGWYLGLAAGAIGLLNLAQLIPMAPLDGGQLLRLLLQRHGSDAARWVAIAASGIACVVAIRFQLYLFVPIALIGLIGLNQRTVLIPQAEPMTGRQRLAIVAGTVATFGILTAASASMLAGIAGYENPRSAVAMLLGFQIPMPGARGSTAIAPAFDVHSAIVGDKPGTTWVSGGDGRMPRIEWRIWGGPARPGRIIAIQSSDKATVFGEILTVSRLSRDITYSVDEDSGEPTFEDDAFTVPTRRGEFAGARFALISVNPVRSCIGFGGYLKAGRTYLSGYSCAAAGATARLEDLSCLLDGLTFAGEPAALLASPTVCAPSPTAAAAVQ